MIINNNDHLNIIRLIYDNMIKKLKKKVFLFKNNRIVKMLFGIFLKILHIEIFRLNV